MRLYTYDWKFLLLGAWNMVCSAEYEISFLASVCIIFSETVGDNLQS